jgi:hypothetical protein
MPHRTVTNPEQRQIEVLNRDLKQAIIKDLQESIKAIYRTVPVGSPEEIQTKIYEKSYMLIRSIGICISFIVKPIKS